jgi:outer membrane cobalamin receptor
VQGNAKLLPEKSIDVDAGIRIGIPWIGKPEISANYFHQKIEGLIIWELGSFSTWRPTNLNAQIEGMEFSFIWPVWAERLVFNINHIELNARDRSFRHTTHNQFLIYRPAQTTRLGVDFQYNQFSMTYQRRIVSKRYVTAANTVSLPGYHVDDITLSLSIHSGPITWRIRGMILNLLNTHYEIIRDAPLPGRHWRAGLEIRY